MALTHNEYQVLGDLAASQIVDGDKVGLEFNDFVQPGGIVDQLAKAGETAFNLSQVDAKRAAAKAAADAAAKAGQPAPGAPQQQPSTPQPSTTDGMSFFKKKAGPLPVWGWFVTVPVIGTGITLLVHALRGRGGKGGGR